MDYDSWKLATPTDEVCYADEERKDYAKRFMSAASEGYHEKIISLETKKRIDNYCINILKTI